MGEYVFCALCKRNVDDGKRHPFTKTHQERVKEVLRNQSEQYAKYKHFLLDVATISSRTKQPDFYCTFCKVKVRPTAKEVMEHVRTFACLHIFEHMATTAHHERVDAWFKTNHGDFKLKKSHVISEKSIGKYRERIRKKTEELDQAEQAKAEWKRRERAEEKDKETRGAQVEIRVEVNGVHSTGISPQGLYQGLDPDRGGWHMVEGSIDTVPLLSYTDPTTEPSQASSMLGPSIESFLAAKRAERKQKARGSAMPGPFRYSKSHRTWDSS